MPRNNHPVLEQIMNHVLGIEDAVRNPRPLSRFARLEQLGKAVGWELSKKVQTSDGIRYRYEAWTNGPYGSICEMFCNLDEVEERFNEYHDEEYHDD